MKNYWKHNFTFFTLLRLYIRILKRACLLICLSISFTLSCFFGHAYSLKIYWKQNFTFLNFTELYFRVLKRVSLQNCLSIYFRSVVFWSCTCYHVFLSFCSHKIMCLLFRKELITSKLSIDILELPIKGKIQAYIPFVNVPCAYWHYKMGWMTSSEKIDIFVLFQVA